VQSQPLRACKLGFTTSHGSQVLCFKYGMDACMALVSGGEVRALCLELGLMDINHTFHGFLRFKS
jgi:hypothetical protein